MGDVATEIFRKYGAVAIIFAIIAALLIWGLAHWAASPGAEVSVLWGLVKYTKPIDIPISRSSSISPAQQNITENKLAAALPTIALDIKNGLTTKNYRKAVLTLRLSHRLRELNSLESGKPISELPAGTYFYINAVYFRGNSSEKLKTKISSETANRFPSGLRDIEVHSISENGMHVIGFLSESDAARISHLSGTTIQDIILSNYPWGSMTSLVSIPLDRIESSSYRNIQISEDENEAVLDLKVK